MLYTVIGALVIGITLGLLGSGGSILTLPLLTYLLEHPSKVAVAESLAIVGGIAAVGCVTYARSGRVDWRTVFLFGGPGMLGSYGGAWIAQYVSGQFQLMLFAIVMLLAAWRMLRPSAAMLRSEASPHEDLGYRQPVWQLAAEGTAIGVMTGLIGVGGGFLIVPALVLLARLPMHRAIGTSLVIIAINAATGLLKYLGSFSATGIALDWVTVATFIVIGSGGTMLGERLSGRLSQPTLRKAFAGFLVAMGIFVLVRESPHAFSQWRHESKADRSASGAVDPHAMQLGPISEVGLTTRGTDVVHRLVIDPRQREEERPCDAQPTEATCRAARKFPLHVGVSTGGIAGSSELHAGRAGRIAIGPAPVAASGAGARNGAVNVGKSIEA